MAEKLYRIHLMVCGGTACVSNGAFKIKDALVKEIQKQGLEDEVLVVTTGCNGFCEAGPLLVVKPDDIFQMVLIVGLVSPLSMLESMTLLTPDKPESCPRLRFRSVLRRFRFPAMILSMVILRLLLYRLTNVFCDCILQLT